jgi:phospholipase/carboxylesterase
MMGDMTAEGDLGFIHRFVPPPAGGDGPTLLLLHGTGGDENDLLDLGRIVAPAAALLSPRGKSLDEGSPRFFRRLREGIFDEADLIFRAGELADFVAAAADRYALDRARIFALGFSNGATIAAAVLLLRPEALAGAVLLRPMVPLEPKQPPDLTGKPVQVVAARHDPMVPVPQTQRLVALLESYGAAVELRWVPGGHGLSHEDLALVHAFLAAQLGTA